MKDYNEQMIDDVVNAIDNIYGMYMNNAELINRLDISGSIKNLDKIICDIMSVKTEASKAALCGVLSKGLQSIILDIQKLENLVHTSNDTFAKIRNKLPMSKKDVHKILRIFNFHDYADDETTAGNLDSYHFAEQQKDALDDVELANSHIDTNVTVEKATDDQFEKIYDKLAGSELDDIDVKDEDVKEVTYEQFTDVVGDTKKLVDELKNANNEKKKPKSKKKGAHPKKQK